MTLQPGKLPAEILARLLVSVPHSDPRVLVGPGVGRDAAVIDMGDRVLVAKMDPVTFATDEIGRYAVNVNANDIACMGATPRWFMATALLPVGAPDDLPGRIMAQIVEACRALDIELIGGHTEVTLGIDHPIIAGAMLGEAQRDDIITGTGVIEGDALILLNGIAIEGTALLARERTALLRQRGVPSDTVDRATAMLTTPGLSIVHAASALREENRPRAMHDPTEGGLATALHELAATIGRTLQIDSDAIYVYEETRAVCAALALDAMGLLASGALLAVVPAEAGERLSSRRNVGGYRCARIGRIGKVGARVIMGLDDSAPPLPTFARDELARFFQSEEMGGES